MTVTSLHENQDEDKFSMTTLLTNHTNIITISPPFTSQMTNRISQNALCERHSEGEGGEQHDGDVEEAFEGYCSVFQRETGSRIFIFVQTFRS